MKSPIIHTTISQSIRAERTAGIARGIAILALILASSIPSLASEAVVLRPGGSTILTFQAMKRVAVADPTVADVVVSSLTELLLIGKNPGQTRVYVWDREGRHELAVVTSNPAGAREVAKKLVEILDSNLRVKVLDDKTILVDGQLHSQADVDRAQRIIKAQQASSLQIVDLVTLEGANLTPAERRAAGLKKLLGDKYKYILWDNDTVIVDGQSDSPEEAERVRKIVEAGAKDFKAESLVTYPGERPDVQVLCQVLTKSLGSNYKVWPLKGRQIVVEGQAADAAGLARTKTLLQAFAKDAEIVDLTAQAPEPAPNIKDRIAVLQETLGKQFNIRSLEDRAIIVEGSVPDDTEATTVRKMLTAIGQQIPVIDMISVVPPVKRQIIVRARIAEIDKTLLRKIGIEWGQLSSGGFSGQPILFDAHTQYKQMFERVFNLQAQQDDNHNRILAEPNLVVNEGDTGNLQVGGEIPIPIAQTSSGGTAITVEYKTYGVIMKITPKVLAGGDKIELKVETEVSSLDSSVAVTLGGFSIPGLRTRRADTILTMNDNATLMMGGLINHDQSRLVRKIPVLGDLPIIGQLFRTEEFKTGKTDLIIMVTPEVMK